MRQSTSPVIKICVNADPIFYETIKSGRAQTISAQVRVYSDDEYIFEENLRSLSGSWSSLNFKARGSTVTTCTFFPFADPRQARIQSKMI